MEDFKEALRDAVLTAIDGTTSVYDVPLMTDHDWAAICLHIDALTERLWKRSSRDEA
jgi:hypothetical protein